MAVYALLKREFVTQLRRVKTMAALLAILLCVGLFLYELWPDDYAYVSHVSRRSREILMVIFMMVGAGVILFIPGIAATTLVSEREQNSWDMLSLTLLGSWKTILGKMIYSMGIYVLILIGMAPFAATVFFMVGIDLYGTLYVCYVILLGIVTFAALGLLASAYQPSTTKAVLHSYLYVALNLGLGYVLLIIVYSVGLLILDPGITRISQLEREFADVPLGFTSFGMFIYSIVAFMNGVMPGLGMQIVLHTVMQLGTIAGALYFTHRRISRPIPTVVQKNIRPKKKKKGRRGVVHTDVVTVPASVNPLRFRELRYAIGLNRRVYGLIAAYAILFPLVLTYCHLRLNMRMDDILVILFVVNIFSISLYALISMANIFTKEDELKNHDMLKMTLLSPKELVWGKIAAGSIMVTRLSTVHFGMTLWFIALPIFNHDFSRWDYGNSLSFFFTGTATLWLSGMLSVLLAGLASVICKKTPTAIITSFIFVIMLHFGNLGVLYGIAEMAYNSFNFSYRVVDEMSIFASPAIGFLRVHLDRPFQDQMWNYFGSLLLFYTCIIILLYALLNKVYLKRHYTGGQR